MSRNLACMFHVSPSENRDSILRHGLDYRRASKPLWTYYGVPQSDGNFLFGRFSEAFAYRFNAAESLRPLSTLDVFKVDARGLEFEDDIQQPGIRAFLREPVPAERVEYLLTLAMP